MWHGLGGENR
ncbi:hypothetical protein YPPY92_4629, partial [Yersinia pestis PY-92]